MLSHPDTATADASAGLKPNLASRKAPLHEGLAGRQCLVLGAGGFLGRALCAALESRGARVRAFGRGRPVVAESGQHALHRRASWTEADFGDRPALTNALLGQEIVFHLLSSSLPDTSNRNPAADVASQVLTSIHLLELCRAAKVRKVVFASSGGTVYGIPSMVPTPEDASTVPISAYGINKLMIERYLELYRHLHGLDYHVLRIANPYGPGQSPFKKQGVVAAMLHRAISGHAIELWGTGEVTRDFIHVDDVCAAFLAAARYDGPHRTMNVGSGQGRSLNQLIADVRHVLDKPALEVVRKGGRAADVPISVLDTSLIRRTTGWEPTVKWLDGLDATAQWMRSAYQH